MKVNKKILLAISTAGLLFTMLSSIVAVYKIKRLRRWKVRPANKSRDKEGVLATLIRDMKLLETDHQQFFTYTRMTPTLFNILLSKVGPLIKKEQRGGSLSPEHRLLITIHYLSEGCSMQEIAWNFRVGKATVSKIIKETCEAIWTALASEYLPQPTPAMWEKHMAEMYRRWNIPNCVGAVDGKHVTIQAPAHSGSEFLNYKKTFSLILMAMCDSYYRFILVDIGAAGGNHDSNIFKNSKFISLLLEGNLGIPEKKKIPRTNIEILCFAIGDAAFPLHSNIMRPYPRRDINEKKNIFNYRLSRARRTIENTFGILVARWRILKKPLTTQIETCEAIVQATVVLLNFLQNGEKDLAPSERKYCPTGFSDYIDNEGNWQNGLWRMEGRRLPSVRRVGWNNPTRAALESRNILAEYFVSQEGWLPWQEEYVNRGGLPG